MRPPVVILCGGRGTRLRERTASMPKALVEIGGRPILEHVIGIYLAHGFRRVLLATGYRGEMIERAVEAVDWPEGVEVRCFDTGIDTPTGGRVDALAAELGGGSFCVTYADGVADVDLGALLEHHRSHGRLATVTVVRPHLPWGVAEIDPEGRVTGFTEKPRSASWVNGGFLCFEPAALELFGPDEVLEQGPMRELAAAGELTAYLHEGFWDCMDTYKDAVALNDLCETGRAPWPGAHPVEHGASTGSGDGGVAPRAAADRARGAPVRAGGAGAAGHGSAAR